MKSKGVKEERERRERKSESDKSAADFLKEERGFTQASPCLAATVCFLPSDCQGIQGKVDRAQGSAQTGTEHLMCDRKVCVMFIWGRVNP